MKRGTGKGKGEVPGGKLVKEKGGNVNEGKKNRGFRRGGKGNPKGSGEKTRDFPREKNLEIKREPQKKKKVGRVGKREN